MKSSTKVTIREIADRAQVSIGTVDRVLHGRGQVAARTRERVLKIVAEERFELNEHASHLRRNRAYEIAVVLPTQTHTPYWDAILAGVRRRAAELSARGVSTVEHLFEYGERTAFEEAAARALASAPSALLLAPVYREATASCLARAAAAGIPTAIIDSELPGAQVGLRIGQDAYTAGRLAGRLLSIGRGARARYLAVSVTNPYGVATPNVSERIRGLRAFLQERGLAQQLFEIAVPDDGQALSGSLDALLATWPEPISILVPNSRAFLICAALRELATRPGTRPRHPDDRLVGFDVIAPNADLLMAGEIDFLIHQRPATQGARAIDGLYRCLIGKTTPDQVAIPAEVITPENLDTAREDHP